MTENDREMLIRVDERTARLEEWAKTHGEAHARISMAFVGAVVSMVLALGSMMVSLLR